MRDKQFLQGRLIRDNMMMTFELNRSMQKGTKGDQGFISLKLDMAKAYNRIEWNFLGVMMRRIFMIDGAL